MTHYAAGHLKEIANKIVTAEDKFAADVVAKIDCSTEEGHKVLAVYKKAKVLKLDLTNQRYTVKHGAFLAADVMRRALEQAK